MSNICDFDNDFEHYECDVKNRKLLGQVWTPYSIIKKMMDYTPNCEWDDESKTDLDPTMGTGNIVISMLYRRIVEHNQNPIIALSNVYGIELDKKTLKYAQERIYKFMMKVEKNLKLKFTDTDWEKIKEIIYNKSKESNYPNFVCSDIFKWNIEKWQPYTNAELYQLEQKKKRKKEEQLSNCDTDTSFW